MTSIVEIRVVLHIPERDKYFIPDAVEKIGDYIKTLFPSFEHIGNSSPIVVSIKELPDETKP